MAGSPRPSNPIPVVSGALDCRSGEGRIWASNSETPKSAMSPEASRISENAVGRRAVRRPVSEFSSKVNCVLNFCARRCMPTLSGRQMISIVSTP